MKPIYKAWQVIEINDMNDYEKLQLAYKQVSDDTTVMEITNVQLTNEEAVDKNVADAEINKLETICYIDGYEAKIVTVITDDKNVFPVDKAEETLWDIFGVPCLYLTNDDFKALLIIWEKLASDLQQILASQSTENIQLLQKALVAIGTRKLFQSKSEEGVDDSNAEQ